MKTVEARELLGRLYEETHSSAEKEKLQLAMDAFEFIVETGQKLDFGEYCQSLDINAPPLVIASFDTREEAMAWLNAHSNPPDGAHVLIAEEYHRIAWFKEQGYRRLPPSPVLPFWLEDLAKEGLPPPVATFNTLEEAKAWVDSQPEPPKQVFIQVAGEDYVVAYHYRINLRALYPMSLAAESQPETEASE